MNVRQAGTDPIRFMSSADSEFSQDKDLLTVAYCRVQKESPEFQTVYEGIDQSVDIKISTFIFRVAPEPVLSLYDFIMTTFVPQSNNQTIDAQEHALTEVPPDSGVSEGRIRVLVKLASVQGGLDVLLWEKNLFLNIINSYPRSRSDQPCNTLFVYRGCCRVVASQNPDSHGPTGKPGSQQRHPGIRCPRGV